MRRKLPKIAAFLLGFLALLPTATRVSGEEAEFLLKFRAEGLRNSKGRLLCLIFSAEKGFPLDPKAALASTDAPIHDGVAVCEFKNLSAGHYAICGFHDENGNEELDLGGLGIPKEGIVATKNAQRAFGPPRFKDALIDYPGGVFEVRAKLKYYL